jgi:hypothetical protein
MTQINTTGQYFGQSLLYISTSHMLSYTITLQILQKEAFNYLFFLFE